MKQELQVQDLIGRTFGTYPCLAGTLSLPRMSGVRMCMYVALDPKPD